MGTGNNDVGKDIPISASGRPLNAAVRPPAKCQGAMSQQGFGWHGNECYPQKLVQLVGHRDPQSHKLWDRLRLTKGPAQPVE